MKSLYLSDLQAGDELDNEPLLLDDVVRRKTRDGRPFLLCKLRDRTDIVNGVFWDVPDYIDSWVKPGLVVLLTGRANTYKDAIQINITDLNPKADPDMAELLPSSTRSRETMLAELRDHIAALSPPWQGLVAQLLLNKEFLPRFANAPAARHMHHAYVGGLMEHSLSMASLAEMVSGHYPYVNKDLLISGALLHDMGKTLEYNVEDAFSFTEDGRLVGHIARAIIMVETAATELNFPPEELRQLIHLIASHHGTLEWGSPVTPKTLEAVLLHQLDLLDSRVQGFFDHLDNDSGDEEWTLRSSNMFGSELKRPRGYGEEDSEELN